MGEEEKRGEGDGGGATPPSTRAVGDGGRSRLLTGEHGDVLPFSEVGGGGHGRLCSGECSGDHPSTSTGGDDQGERERLDAEC